MFTSLGTTSFARFWPAVVSRLPHLDQIDGVAFFTDSGADIISSGIRV